MNKTTFNKLRPKYNKQVSANIKLHTLDELPQNTQLVKDISEFIGYTGRVTPDIVYFAKNIEGKYYIELTTEDTNEEELIEYIKLNLIYK